MMNEPFKTASKIAIVGFCAVVSCALAWGWFGGLLVGSIFAIATFAVIVGGTGGFDHHGALRQNGAVQSLFDSDDQTLETQRAWAPSAATSIEWLKPIVNIDGTPMIGDFDIHGNPYGVTSIDMFEHHTDWSSGESFGSSSTSWE